MLTARDLPDSPVVRRLLEWVAETGEAACQEMSGLFTASGTASILMLILPNSVKSAPHLVEYLPRSPNTPARCRIAFCMVIRQDAPKREVRILFLQELPDLCS